MTGKEIELDIEPNDKVQIPRSRDPTRTHAPTHPLTNHPEVQVAQIKEKVEEKEGIPPVQQRLIYGGKQMFV